mmetsp:Transcript_130592/g.377743  ORF Transcript_130592/g.377743 Transcript_130592/m.377743 type:complete len:88 (-) Transcript_130592:72-335(-)
MKLGDNGMVFVYLFVIIQLIDDIQRTRSNRMAVMKKSSGLFKIFEFFMVRHWDVNFLPLLVTGRSSSFPPEPRASVMTPYYPPCCWG